MASDVKTTLADLIECACSALADINRAVCDCGSTIGPPDTGPHRCCTDCDGNSVGGEVVGFLERVYPVTDKTTFEQATRLENCRPGAIAADFTITVIRCYPSVNEQLQMPTLDTTTPYADAMADDMSAVWAALQCCGTDIAVRESAVDADPEGGCSAFAIRVTTLVTMKTPTVDVS